MKTRLITTTIVLCVLNFLGGFAGFTIYYFGGNFGSLTEPVFVIIAFAVNLVVFVLVMWSILKERSLSLWNFLWAIIPAGLTSLLFFLGYEVLKAIDRANPSF
jgi:uncharacterized MnhB-related membrane protein